MGTFGSSPPRAFSRFVEEKVKMASLIFVFVLALASMGVESACPASKLPCCYALPMAGDNKAEKIDCEKCRAQAIMLDTARPGGFVPDCTKANEFKSKQCQGNKCWCSDKDGKNIKGTGRPAKRAINCDKARKANQAKKLRRMPCNIQRKKGFKGFKPKCDQKGFYEKEQCMNRISYCFCSLPTGSAIPGTIYRKNDKKKPNCSQHIDLKYDCKNMGFYKHPFDITRFMKCGAGGKGYVCSCPSGLGFNGQVCDWIKRS